MCSRAYPLLTPHIYLTSLISPHAYYLFLLSLYSLFADFPLFYFLKLASSRSFLCYLLCFLFSRLPSTICLMLAHCAVLMSPSFLRSGTCHLFSGLVFFPFSVLVAVAALFSSFCAYPLVLIICSRVEHPLSFFSPCPQLCSAFFLH